MFTSIGLVHIIFILAITVIVLFQIVHKQDYSFWLPLITAVVGYLFPEPKIMRRTRSNSMLHLETNEIEKGHELQPMSSDEKATPPSVRLTKNATKTVNLLFEALPSVLLFVGAVVWVCLLPPANAANENAPVFRTVLNKSFPYRETYTLPAVDVQKDLLRLNYSLTIDCDQLRPVQFIVAHNARLAVCRHNNTTVVHVGSGLSRNSIQLPFDLWKKLISKKSYIKQHLNDRTCKLRELSVLLNFKSCNKMITMFIVKAPSFAFLLDPESWDLLLYHSPTINRLMKLSI